MNTGQGPSGFNEPPRDSGNQGYLSSIATTMYNWIHPSSTNAGTFEPGNAPPRVPPHQNQSELQDKEMVQKVFEEMKQDNLRGPHETSAVLGESLMQNQRSHPYYRNQGRQGSVRPAPGQYDQDPYSIFHQHHNTIQFAQYPSEPQTQDRWPRHSPKLQRPPGVTSRPAQGNKEAYNNLSKDYLSHLCQQEQRVTFTEVPQHYYHQHSHPYQLDPQILQSAPVPPPILQQYPQHLLELTTSQGSKERRSIPKIPKTKEELKRYIDRERQKHTLLGELCDVSFIEENGDNWLEDDQTFRTVREWISLKRNDLRDLLGDALEPFLDKSTRELYTRRLTHHLVYCIEYGNFRREDIERLVLEKEEGCLLKLLNDGIAWQNLDDERREMWMRICYFVTLPSEKRRREIRRQTPICFPKTYQWISALRHSDKKMFTRGVDQPPPAPPPRKQPKTQPRNQPRNPTPQHHPALPRGTLAPVNTTMEIGVLAYAVSQVCNDWSLNEKQRRERNEWFSMKIFGDEHTLSTLLDGGKTEENRVKHLNEWHALAQWYSRLPP